MKSYIAKHKQSFGVVARDYKKYRGEYTDALYEMLLVLLKKQKMNPVTVLDIGCGVGNSTEPLLRKAVEQDFPITLCGCDPDTAMIREAKLSAKKQKLPIVYTEGSAERLPYSKGEFTAAFSGAAFHWFATKKALKEIQRVLAPKGMYVAFWSQSEKTKSLPIGVELYREYGFQGIPKDLRDPKNIKQLFISAGFEKVTTRKISFTEVRSVTESLGLIRTNSGYAVLSEKDKKEFMKKMKRAYDLALPEGREEAKQVIHVCYGFKK